MKEEDNEPDSPSREEIVVPVIEEHIDAGRRAVKKGSVRVDKFVEKRVRRVNLPVIHEEVEVRRVPIDRVVKERPEVRREGNATIIPVVEEQVVVTKRLVLKEEIHLIRKRRKSHVPQVIETERERAEVHRLDPDGRIIETSETHPAKPETRRTRTMP